MTIYTLDTVLNFGKYKGRKVKEVIEDGNGDYLAWAVDNIEWFELDDVAEIELNNDLYPDRDIDWKSILGE